MFLFFVYLPELYINNIFSMIMWDFIAFIAYFFVVKLRLYLLVNLKKIMKE